MNFQAPGMPPDGGTLNSQVYRGGIHTADALIGTPAQKDALFRHTGALAVEMEGKRVPRRLVATSDRICSASSSRFVAGVPIVAPIL